MICPHCRKDVKYKERSGQTCGSCRRRFALEPKTDPLRLHDVRLLRLGQKLSDSGSYRFTAGQLYYAAAAKVVRGTGTIPVGAIVGTLLVGLMVGGIGSAVGLPLLLIPLGVCVVIWVIYAVVRFATRRSRRIEPPINQRQFASTVLDGWRRTYGQEVPGVVREEQVTDLGAHPPEPVLAVLSPSRSALVALRANDVPARYRVALADHPDRLPPGVPVVLLHDVSVDGYRFAGQARAALGPRVVADLTPRPRAVKAAKGALKLRQPAPPADVVGWLRASGMLSEDDVAWLAHGWWMPIEAVRPSVLIDRVAAAARRRADPEQRTAESVGFLSWPGAGRAA